MVRWLRVTFPVPIAIVPFLLFLLAVELFALYFYSWTGDLANVRTIHRVRDGALLAAAVLYGIFRTWSFHPLLRKSYRDWLLLTPWRYGKPLPLGPVRIVLQDLIAMSLLLLIGLFLPYDWQMVAHIPAYFLFAYAFGQALAFFRARQWFWFYLTIFGLTVSVRLAPMPLGIADLFLVLLYFCTWLGNRQTLLRMPEDEPTFTQQPQSGLFINRRTEQRYEVPIGHPFNELRPELFPWQISRGHGFMLSLYAGVVYYVFLHVAQHLDHVWHPLDHVAYSAMPVFFFLPIVLSVLYLFPLRDKHYPAISLIGRLLTGHLYLPKYDIIYAPCVGLLALFGMSLYLAINQFPHLATWLTTSVILQFMMVTVLAPDVARWRLTSPCQIRQSKLFEEQQKQLKKNADKQFGK